MAIPSLMGDMVRDLSLKNKNGDWENIPSLIISVVIEKLMQIFEIL